MRGNDGPRSDDGEQQRWPKGTKERGRKRAGIFRSFRPGEYWTRMKKGRKNRNQGTDVTPLACSKKLVRPPVRDRRKFEQVCFALFA